MTKPCKSCKEQIDEAATKCPRCQSYQHWYRNPRMLHLLWLLLLAFLFWNPYRRPRPITFADHKDKFSVSVVEENARADGRTWLVTVRLENQSERTWRRPKFQVESLDGNEKLLCVEHASEHNVVVGPKSSALATLSLRTIPAQPVAKRRVTLTDLEANRF